MKRKKILLSEVHSHYHKKLGLQQGILWKISDEAQFRMRHQTERMMQRTRSNLKTPDEDEEEKKAARGGQWVGQKYPKTAAQGVQGFPPFPTWAARALLPSAPVIHFISQKFRPNQDSQCKHQWQGFLKTLNVFLHFHGLKGYVSITENHIMYWMPFVYFWKGIPQLNQVFK